VLKFRTVTDAAGNGCRKDSAQVQCDINWNSLYDKSGKFSLGCTLTNVYDANGLKR
jgi:hypothetical protein